MKLYYALMLLLLPETVSAATVPSWIKPLPHKELRCDTLQTNGLQWDEKDGKYFQARYPVRGYMIEKLGTADPRHTENDCKIEDSLDYNDFDDTYTRSSCYSYNAAVFMGWTQGWCKESYMRSGPVYGTCDHADVFQPRISFSPSGYFYTYGHIRNVSLSEPGLRGLDGA